MLDFIETVRIEAPASSVWDTIVDVGEWWLPSNPEHDSIERLDGGDLVVGTRLRIRERIAGVPGEAIGVITGLEPGTSVTWRADHARYRLLGLTVTIGEGVTWRVVPDGAEASRLSAQVWATVPDGLTGLALRSVFIRLLDGITKDRRHTRIELDYLKACIERAHA